MTALTDELSVESSPAGTTVIMTSRPVRTGTEPDRPAAP
jgi:hypothetical protein